MQVLHENPYVTCIAAFGLPFRPSTSLTSLRSRIQVYLYVFLTGPICVLTAGRPLIMINGVGGTKSSWNPCLLRPLAAGEIQGP